MSDKHELRDDSGQYAVAFDRLCRCGHRKGWHEAGAKGRSLGACLAGTADMFGDTACPCLHFKATRKVRPVVR